MRVLLSIKPDHVANIMSGKKVFEFRRKVFARRDVRVAIIYCTMPVGRIVGEFDIVDIIRDSPDRLWERSQWGSGISREYFDSYFDGCKDAYALQIGNVREFEPHINPSDLVDKFTPPQSYMYIGEDRKRDMATQLELLWS
ncbi:protein of unknown function DUF437 [Beijerinckia indica subsp. indica ATCC 9039]|uniref:ASCH domain-containing protein n=1 Tax=Beijerinckia indica subsp. indica (strain ATCC 9039 / DSM 1715 / NCIMB 8712) TaxID=395963 RepID=B2IF59_BEII9|nr:protein of unknown function DUF437 [Beijerinckia indica subsp. indica ATCC 9039]